MKQFLFIFSAVFVLFFPCEGKVSPLENISSELRASAKTGNIESIFQIGVTLFEGAFDEVDAYQHLVTNEESMALAMSYLKEAASKGHPKANGMLGSLYFDHCDLVKRDIKKAISFYKKAIYLGDMESVSKLAFIYYYIKKYKESIFICKTNMAKSGEYKKDIFSILSLIYEDTKSGYKNFVKSYACKKIILSLDPKYRPIYFFEKEMTEGQKVEAEEIVRQWIKTGIFPFE